MDQKEKREKLRDELIQLLSEDRLREAFELLRNQEYLNGKDRQSLVGIGKKIKQLEQDEALGSLSQEEKSILQNRIRYELLNVHKNLEATDLSLGKWQRFLRKNLFLIIGSISALITISTLVWDYSLEFKGLLSLPEKGLDAKYQEGQVGIEVEREMIAGEDYLAKVSLSWLSGQIKLIADSGSIIQPNLSLGKVYLSSLMKVDVSDPQEKNFNIVPLSEEFQPVDSLLPASWIFSITPIRKGIHPLYLGVIAKTQTEFGAQNQHIETFPITIQVEPNPQKDLNDFWSSNWKWVFTIFIIPIFLWGRKKYLKWKEKQNEAPISPVGYKNSEKDDSP